MPEGVVDAGNVSDAAQSREMADGGSDKRAKWSLPLVIGTCDEARKKEGTVRFTIAHFNDMQARYSDRIDGRSRYAYVAGYLRQLKKEVPETLVLDAGDDYEKGSVAEVRSNGETTRAMVQALPIDVRTIGNHDFAYGEEAVLRDVRESAHPVLAANVRHTKLSAAEQPFLPFVRADVGCVRVGIVGVVTQNYAADDTPTKEPFDGVFEQDIRYVDAIEREIAAHRQEVDVMIALTHIGLFVDAATATNPRTRGLDFVFGGHTEELLRWPALVRRKDGSRVSIMQAGHFARNVGRADFVVNLRDKTARIEKYRVIDVDASLPHADDVAELVDHLEHDAAPTAQTVIAHARSEIPQGRSMAALTTRAAMSAWGAHAVVIGRDLFWEGLPSGPITLQRLYDSVFVQRQPSGTQGFSSLWTVELTGAELQALRVGFRGSSYEATWPPKIDPAARYRLVLDKRALTYPHALFGPRAKLPEAKLGGEMIDLLETYARARTAAGLPIE